MHKHRLLGLLALVAALGLIAVVGVAAASAQAEPVDPVPPCGYDGPWGGMMGGWDGQGRMMSGRGGMRGYGGGRWGYGQDTPPYGAPGDWGGYGGMMGRGGRWGYAPYGDDDAWSGYGGMMGQGMMMGGRGGMMGRGGRWGYAPNAQPYGGNAPWGGMMGAWTPPADLAPAGETLTLDEAVNVAEAYIAEWDGEPALELGEVIQFSNHFYAVALEADTGRGAFEFLIDPATGAVAAEPGPNMMWNLRYGHHAAVWGAAETGEAMPVSADEARESAQAFLDEAFPGLQAAEEAEAFYGYYTFEILEDGETAGMLSVNGYDGQVWLHRWHGEYVGATSEE